MHLSVASKDTDNSFILDLLDDKIYAPFMDNNGYTLRTNESYDHHFTKSETR